jgi:predicted nucleic acid-binding protein
MPLLIDSAVYVDLLRSKVDVRARLLQFLPAGELYNCGVVRAEVGRGIVLPRLREEMEAFFDLLPEVPTDAEMWREVSRIGWTLGRRGKWPPVADLAIAACAIRVNATLISPDAHFRDVPGLSLEPKLPER